MIGIVGLNHKSAPVEIREQFVFNEKDIVDFYNQLDHSEVKAVVIVSTCNRTEVYFEAENCCKTKIFENILNELASFKKCTDNIAPYFYTLAQSEAANHLFHVLSGLDSMALGEYQIVGQIKEAIKVSSENDLINGTLTRLFNKAFESGKRVRTETNINRGAVSMSYAAVELASQKLDKLTTHPVLLIGAGQTSELVMQNLVKKGCQLMSVANRTHSKAVEMAAKYKGKAVEFDSLLQNIVENDIIITSTGSSTALVTVDMVAEAMKQRNNRPVIMVDLSVPRNIQEEVGNIDNVFVYDVDDLANVVQKNYEMRQGEIEKAESIISELVAEFSDWMYTKNLNPAIKSISEGFKEINRAELSGFRKNDLKAEEYGDHITNKFIRLMIKNVKEITDNGKREEYVSMINKLFELQQECAVK